jgi:hypothetical protein
MMNLKKFVLTFSVFALAIASAASSYKVEISSPVSVGETKLKAGTYDIRMEADKVIFKSGKTSVQVPATFEKNPSKFKENQMSTINAQLKDIELGGTTTKIIFGATASGDAAAGGK